MGRCPALSLELPQARRPYASPEVASIKALGESLGPLSIVLAVTVCAGAAEALGSTACAQREGLRGVVTGGSQEPSESPVTCLRLCHRCDGV